jgi:cellulose synthase/poly-beta-1,6-N-acetylglucosamine synthase-like glycosyltransferase
MLDWFANIFITVYFTIAFTLMVYGLNCYIMLFLFKKGRQKATELVQRVGLSNDDVFQNKHTPMVTTQIPVYNEYNVIERVMLAACQMEYPSGFHEIQVLDDSTDKTSWLIDRTAEKLTIKGYDIVVVRRKNRLGYKAGALANGLAMAKGELIAVFDADFVPPKDYLIKTAPFFMADDNLGFVQARWGHLNHDKSLLTHAQSIGIDGHFMIEQSARNWGNLFMNFNGTAGIWRKQAIIDGGGWEWDTLTEDMDLSYRVQGKGWGTVFLPNLVVPAEIPEDINSFKSQQFRWAKGSMQTAMKLLPAIFRSQSRMFKKIEAFFHLTHYAVHPMMLTLALLALPVLVSSKFAYTPFLFTFLAIILVLSMSAPNILYLVGQRSAYPDWKKRIVYLPFLVVFGVGVAVSNSRAVCEALLRQKSEFVRTPKKGDKEKIAYRLSFPWIGIIEVVIGIYCSCSFYYYLSSGKFLVGPFLAIYASGFLFTGLLTLFHSLDISK